MNEALRDQLALLPRYLGHHLQLSVFALVFGIALSIPLAVAAVRVKGLQGPVLGFAGVVQTIPALALLALMVPLLGRIGFLPALLALILYSMLPVLRNTVTGLQEIDPNLIEAARGIGMTPNQMLVRVQFPLAMPVIIAGIRTATVWVVGMATLATPVGAPSLGNYIFQGLQIQNYYAVMVGCIAAAFLALGLDGLIRLLEQGYRTGSKARTWAGAIGLAVVLVLGAAPTLTEFATSSKRPVFRIGAKSFTEQYILSELISKQLESRGIPSTHLDSLGSTVVFDALAVGRIDCYVDYSGTIWANHMKRGDNPGAEAVLREMTAWLKEKHGIVCLGPLGFENAYALAMREDHADALGLEGIADLARAAPSLIFGTDYEFLGRPEWKTLREAYGLQFRKEVTMDPALMYRAVAEEEVDVISAFSTDGRIVSYGLRVLEDPREALPPYDAVLLISGKAAANPFYVSALEPLIGMIDDESMRRANKWVDEDKRSVADVAKELYAVLLATP